VKSFLIHQTFIAISYHQLSNVNTSEAQYTQLAD